MKGRFMRKKLNVIYIFPKNISTLVTRAILNTYERNKEFIDKKFNELEREKIKL